MARKPTNLLVLVFRVFSGNRNHIYWTTISYSNRWTINTIICGAWGIRTLVQTSNTQAFYMLILLLVFVVKQTANSQLYAYLLKFSFPNRSFSGLISAFSMPRNRTSQNRTFGRHLVSLLYFGKNANPTKLRIKQQEQTLRCQLNSVARD